MVKTVSVVTSAYNEEESIEELARRLRAVFDELSAYQFEAIVVENGSVDGTFDKLRRIHQEDPRFKIVRLSRNFRMDGGVTAGLRFATGDAAIIMTAALKEPPEMIKDFIKKWEEGYDHVYGIVRRRPGTAFLRKVNSQVFYWIINKCTGGMIPKNVSDFRLADRKVYEVLNQMDERNRFLRGMFVWTGFKSIGIEFERAPRFRGQSKAYTLGVVELALKGIFAFSNIPLKMISIVGLIVSVFSFVALAIIIIRVLAWGVPFPGFGTIMAVMLLMFGFGFTALGVIAEYIALIYEEVKQRPNFVVGETLGL
ncbi:MAG: glycosyltransferase family 2 protein [Nitrospira sp. CG24A]|nr:MAG: glycosyltransferase family 2 protein [Nitrospira sp. CG24A]